MYFIFLNLSTQVGFVKHIGSDCVLNEVCFSYNSAIVPILYSNCVTLSDVVFFAITAVSHCVAHFDKRAIINNFGGKKCNRNFN